jgi:2-oxoglutarate ferredoxin oxidoreductase subunit gamma
VHRSVVFAGFGGQGLLFAGEVLAEASLGAGLETIWIPSYGPEMRGGTASCTVILGDEPVGSPSLDQFDMALILNAPSLARFGPLIAPGGLAVVNESLVHAALERGDVVELRVACTTLAGEAGHERITAVVGLGALVAGAATLGGSAIPAPEGTREALRTLVSRRHPDLLEANLNGFDAGLAAAAAVDPQRAGSIRSSPV